MPKSGVELSGLAEVTVKSERLQTRELLQKSRRLFRRHVRVDSSPIESPIEGAHVREGRKGVGREVEVNVEGLNVFPKTGARLQLLR